MVEVVAKRFHITGRVQGVFYRASTRQQAQQLNISGYAKNLANGRVEVLAIGAATAIEQLEQWLWQGPPAAQVSAVDAVDVVLDSVTEHHSDFKTH